MQPDAPTARPRHRRSLFLAPFRIAGARPQLTVSIFVGVVLGMLLPPDLRPVTRAVIGWNGGLIAYFVLVAILMSQSSHAAIRRRAGRLDEGRLAILVLTTACACASFGAIVAELGPVKTMQGAAKTATIALTIFTVLNSWFFLHLSFAFHYAHEFYSGAHEATAGSDAIRGGLKFPQTPEPQYLDFLYFSYIIGVACQTADVEICSRRMRVVALAHGVVAFFFNTTILALMVNIASQFV